MKSSMPAPVQTELFKDSLLLGSLLFIVGVAGLVARRHALAMLLSGGIAVQGIILLIGGGSAFRSSAAGEVLALGVLGVGVVQAILALTFLTPVLAWSVKADLSTWDRLCDPELVDAERESPSHSAGPEPSANVTVTERERTEP